MSEYLKNKRRCKTAPIRCSWSLTQSSLRDRLDLSFFKAAFVADIEFNVNHAVRRAASYWEIDGLWRIAFAVGLVLMASVCLWMSHFHSLRRLWPMWMFSSLIIAAYIYLLGLRNSPLMRWLKARITYPRTGYVAVPPSANFEPRLETWMFLPVGVPGLFEDAWIGAILLAVATSILWGVTKGRFPFARILIPGFYLSEIFLAILPTAPSYRIWYTFIAFSLVELFAGIIQLRSHLRRHPAVRA
ncbi:MAG TPA: hypothetical protein VKL99_03475 [Candidatus Angelobacter sp.]|nr:hypothetical protein [Candidatus Angelobacter sp.]